MIALMQPNTAGPTLWEVYHNLWGLAKEGPSYEKREWNHLFHLVESKRDERDGCVARSMIMGLARRQGVSDTEILRVVLGQKKEEVQ